MSHPTTQLNAKILETMQDVERLEKKLAEALKKVRANSETAKTLADKWNDDVYMPSFWRRVLEPPKSVNFSPDAQKTVREMHGALAIAAVTGLMGLISTITYGVYYGSSFVGGTPVPANSTLPEDLSSNLSGNISEFVGYAGVPILSAISGAVYQGWQNYWKGADLVTAQKERIAADIAELQTARVELENKEQLLNQLRKDHDTAASELQYIKTSLHELKTAINELQQTQQVPLAHAGQATSIEQDDSESSESLTYIDDGRLSGMENGLSEAQKMQYDIAANLTKVAESVAPLPDITSLGNDEPTEIIIPMQGLIDAGERRINLLNNQLAQLDYVEQLRKTVEAQLSAASQSSDEGQSGSDAEV